LAPRERVTRFTQSGGGKLLCVIHQSGRPDKRLTVAGFHPNDAAIRSSRDVSDVPKLTFTNRLGPAIIAFPVGAPTCAMNRTAVLYALLSAALFGVSTPAAKILIGSIHPVTLAGLLYCGAGIGVAVLRRIVPSVVTGAPETAVTRVELPWLAAAIGAGGILGPLLLMVGLARTNATTASLLLTLEGVATALMAWFIFHENFDRRIAIGMASLVAGAAVLSWSGAPTFDSIVGPIAIAGACVSWGLDN
jgi:uncharacterized membrane protein